MSNDPEFSCSVFLFTKPNDTTPSIWKVNVSAMLLSSLHHYISIKPCEFGVNSGFVKDNCSELALTKNITLLQESLYTGWPPYPSQLLLLHS